MSEKLLTDLINLVKWVGSVAIGVWGGVKAFKDYNERQFKESVAKAKETSAGATAVEAIRTDIAKLEEQVEKIHEDMFNEKRELQSRLEKLRDHFEEMTRDYFKILSNK